MKFSEVLQKDFTKLVLYFVIGQDLIQHASAFHTFIPLKGLSKNVPQTIRPPREVLKAVAWNPLKAVAGTWDARAQISSLYQRQLGNLAPGKGKEVQFPTAKDFAEVKKRSSEVTQVNQGLAKLSMTYGWCLTDGDIYSIEQLKNDLLPSISYLKEQDIFKIMVALEVAYQAHNGQRRKSGEPYVIHPVEVAKILGELRMDAKIVVAGLLHDTVEDTPLTLEDLAELFGDDVSAIVKGETKVSKLPQQGGQQVGGGVVFSDKQAENLRCMLVAMAKDARVVVVKLADRLHNMRTLGAMPPHKQQRIAKETVSIFVPLAQRLGVYTIKSELEDLCFSILQPEEYSDIVERINRFKYQSRDARGEALTQQVRRLEVFLKESSTANLANNIRVEIMEHSPSDIWRRSQRNGKSLPDTIDPTYLRILFKAREIPGLSASAQEKEEQATCYRLLESVHTLFRPTSPLKVKDYIAFPKLNGYRSLHTQVVLESQPIEVQIRTYSMERVAKYGMAAQWLEDSHLADYLSLPWLDLARSKAFNSTLPTATGQEFADNIRDQLRGQRFVVSAKGLVSQVAAEANATVGSVVARQLAAGEHLVAVKVNGRQVPLTHPLREGDIVSTVLTTPLGGQTAAAAAVPSGAQSLTSPQKEVSPHPMNGTLWCAACEGMGVPLAPPAFSQLQQGGGGGGEESPNREGQAFDRGQKAQAVRVSVVSSMWPWNLVGEEEEVQQGEDNSQESIEEFFRPVAEGTGPVSPSTTTDFEWYRLAEIKHGRMCMVLLLFLFVPEIWDYIIAQAEHLPPTPFLPFYSYTPAQVLQLLVLVGIGEFIVTIIKNMQAKGSIIIEERRSNSIPVMLEEEKRQIQGLINNEILYGRLAMLGISAMLLQAAVEPMHLTSVIYWNPFIN
mmetsp:Transcript_14422/g.18837  ORF Transcript_14422/g.18837 Transcript_14422/m.18837 type:complete len:899 (+) Transcript_14422:66-2762(+)